MDSTSLRVSKAQRVCVNCIHYRLYYCQGDSGAWIWEPTCFGLCRQSGRQRGPLCKPCKEYETKESAL